MVSSAKDRPSPSDIFISPEWIWEPASVYQETKLAFPDGGTGWKMFIDRKYTLIPFLKDPVLYAYPIPGTKSQDPLFDREHHLLYLDGADPGEHKILVDWLANEWLNPPPGEQPRGNIIFYEIPGKFRAVHRLHKVYTVDGTRYWRFRGDNNFLWFWPLMDPYPALDEHIKWLVCSVIY